MNAPAGAIRSGKCSPLGLFIAGFGLVNFFGPLVAWSASSETLAMFVFGVVGAEQGLLAIWAVLGPQPWTQRIPLTLAIAAFFYTALFAGMATPEGFFAHWPELVLAYLFLPLVFFAAQLPLWIVRMAGGYRIVRPGALEEGRSAASRQFQVQDMLGAMVVVAVCLGLASLGLSQPDFSGGPGWAGPLVAALLFSGASALTTLPSLWAAFLARDKGAGAAVIGVYVIVVTVVTLFIGSVLAGSVPPPEAFADLFLFVAALLITILGVLTAFRVSGYVLCWAGRRPPDTPRGHASQDSSPGANRAAGNPFQLG